MLHVAVLLTPDLKPKGNCLEDLATSVALFSFELQRLCPGWALLRSPRLARSLSTTPTHIYSLRKPYKPEADFFWRGARDVTFPFLRIELQKIH
jgi:hypothetical protein